MLRRSLEDDGSYIAEYPDLKGCITVADSLMELFDLFESPVGGKIK